MNRTNEILSYILAFLIGCCLTALFYNIRIVNHPIEIHCTITLDKNESEDSSQEKTIEKNEETKTQENFTIYAEDLKEDPRPSSMWSEKDAILLAQMAWGEARGVQPITKSSGFTISSTYQQACTMWCVLNRVDAGYGDIRTVVTAPNQFQGYSSGNPIDDELLDLAKTVLTEWAAEHLTSNHDSNRVLPATYLYFYGDGRHNYFDDGKGNTYNWALPDPY